MSDVSIPPAPNAGAPQDAATGPAPVGFSDDELPPWLGERFRDLTHDLLNPED